MTGARLDRALETTIYRVVQETLTDAVRGSGATSVLVRLHGDDTSVRLEVHDDGTEGALSEEAGLVGVRERVELAGGDWAVGDEEEDGPRPRVTASFKAVPPGEDGVELQWGSQPTLPRSSNQPIPATASSRKCATTSGATRRVR